MDAELAIVCQLLNCAAIYIKRSSFEEQWSPEFVTSAFQWTAHLEARLADLKDDAQVGVVAFLDDMQEKDPKGPWPTAEELLQPTVSLKKRLIANTALSGSVAAVILRMGPLSDDHRYHDQAYDPMADILKSVRSRAVGNILQGTLAHFSATRHRLDSRVSPPEISTSIQYKAKARVLLNQLDRPCSEHEEDRLVSLVSKLHEYLAVSPEEAKLKRRLNNVNIRNTMVFNNRIA
ncbi:hypothetical protein BGZ93_002029 [Podila epicladia]|nr:hypothetical protein BGZ93_002029 [Podila epicladia]KAG0084702.1 hypothetical protein BGZ92_009648 [Podila epicladia]